VRRALVLLATVVASTCAVAGPAWGAGDPAIDRLIVKNPVPGWSALSPAIVQALVSTEEKTESALSNQKATAGVEGWQGSDSSQELIVIIDRLPENIPDGARNARAGAITGCASATGNPPTSVRDYPQISGAVEGMCSGTNADGLAIAVTTMVWVRGNVIVFVLGVGLPSSQVESIAESQDSAIPPAGVHESASASGTGTVIAIVVGAAVVVLGLVVGLVVRAYRRRHRAALSPPRWSAPDGGAHWAADPSGQHELRYWSGTAWTEHVMSNGIPATDRLPSPTESADALVTFPAASFPATSYPAAADPVTPDPVAAHPAVSGMGAVSDDGHWFWNGTSWVSTTSSDGRMRWNGTQWVEVPGHTEPFS
jgi:hypothetical protein